VNWELPIQPLASCITPTANRRRFLPQAIECFLEQDYSNKELIIVDDGEDAVGDLVPRDERIRYIRLSCKTVLGEKRNQAAAEARGELIVHWDDDDWSAPWRLRYQVEELLGSSADICGLDRLFFYAPSERRAWEYVYPTGQRPWVYGASLAYRKAFWATHPFPQIGAGEDTRFVWADTRARIHVLKDPHCLIALMHDGNCSPKRTFDPRYWPRPVEEIEMLFGDDLSFYADLKSSGQEAGRSLAKPESKPQALVSAALGIGDILRVTPLIRIIHRLGYEVDMLLATDYADAVGLLEGAPEIRKIFHLPSPRRRTAPSQLEGLSNQTYELATFTAWSVSLRDHVQARNVRLFEREQWIAEGDSRCIERIARELGWHDELPLPFAMASNRKFGLPPGTVAIHPGCKYEWPWKKWHGFDELARLFSNIVIVGTEEDRRSDNTYFARPFSCPEHAQSFVGRLSLSDTAALLRECAALVANDSGLMHLGVALGIPTFGIFGITNPDREMIRAPNMFPITKGLPCEPACREGAWGRRDCEHHLRCLKTLTPEEVYMKVTATLPALKNRSSTSRANSAAPPHNHQTITNETIRLAYYGYVFDASGYGQAARAYLHALHRAGIKLTVVDLAANRARQVEDLLVASLIGQPIDADFHLFHGTPPLWARMAFPLRNVIAMTVWETDTMPTQWRSILMHALDVWLPCEFNATVFSAALGKPVFKLPHPVFSAEANGSAASDTIDKLEIQADDFVFYSIFEWQDRKSPERTLEAYFRAFREEDTTILVLKTNAGASVAAARALAEMRRRIGSRARATVRAEAWSEAQIAALHARGDCYVSLHRGEGWGYPLFAAASQGNPVIATGYSGPLDFLNADAHCLVRHTLTAVQQLYAFYRPSMKWAEPDTAHAIELMRTVRSQPDEVRERAAGAAKRLVRDFSIDEIGRRAKRRLSDLLHRTDSVKWERLDRAQRTGHLRPLVPIPSEWFDADYFENGVKSNWKNGYHWRDFAGLFRETAQFLVTMFPEAASFLDAGCAKGFLVRALRELGKDAWGFDHSSWALEHAEESARPFLHPACAESVEFDRRFDLTLAFSLLENLTEEQAIKFLRRAREWTTQALIVVVVLCEDETKRAQLLTEDRDLAHVTLQSHGWWQERLLRTGWRRDALHRIAERALRTHPLAMRMRWDVFACTPQ
jgi:ADP-heptose:LPS heptosyltransferase/2-polyprenyl-3-methyl-5-hydroxy-6-metoxy-1,4-benzoquinol methylase